jgi:DNA-binding NarL/FixJ family response regulator
MKKTRVLLVEDHELLRDGLKAALGRDEHFEVVGEACDGQSACHKVVQLLPDIIVMDIGLPQMDGIEATKKIKLSNPEIKIIMLTSHQSQSEIFASLAAGANGYCLKDLTGERLLRAVHSVAEGAAWIDPRIAQSVLSVFSEGQYTKEEAKDNVKNQYQLSQREVEVLRLLAEGLGNKEIAKNLKIGVSTVRTHVEHILQKLSVSGRTEAAVKAMRQGLI